MSQRVCDRCIAQTVKGAPCARRTCRTALCWQHLKKERGLRIKKSLEPNAGLGLFAARDFKRRERISAYSGDHLSLAQMKQRYPKQDGKYVLCVGERCIDSRGSDNDAARFANTTVPARTNKRNARLTKSFSLVARRAIPAGREVLTSYGSSYKLNAPGRKNMAFKSAGP